MKVLRWIDEWQQRHAVPAFVVAVVRKFGDDQAGHLVALLSYYAFVATFPLLLVLVTVTGIVLRSNPEWQQKLIDSAFSEFPIIGEQIQNQLGIAAFGNTALSLTIGIVGALWGARGFAGALQHTMNTLWTVRRVDRPGFPMSYLRMAGLMLVIALAVVATAATTTIAGWGAELGMSGRGTALLVFFLSVIVDSAVFLAVFRIATARRIETKSMVLGAVIAGTAWPLLLSLAGILLAHSLRHAQAVAGLFGIVLGLLAWFALQGTVTIYAIEADVVRSRKLWPRSLFQPPLTEADKDYLIATAEAETRRPEEHVAVSFDAQSAAQQE